MTISFNPSFHTFNLENKSSAQPQQFITHAVANLTAIDLTEKSVQGEPIELKSRSIVSDNIAFSYENELTLVNTSIGLNNDLREQAGLINITSDDLYEFNAHSAPGGTLMSTRRPSGDLDAYASMLKSYDISVLISIDAYAPEALTEKLASKGISHVNEDKFHIEDFFGKGELPQNKLKDIVNKITEHENLGLKVAIHCGAGNGRSGTVKSAYILDKIITDLRQKDELSNTLTNIDTHYNQHENTTVIGSVSDAITTVRNEGHREAVERSEDVYALQDFYDQMTATAYA